MFDKNKERYANELIEIKNAGLYKNERIITTPQGVEIKTKEAGNVLNFCANNYLGLSNNPQLIILKSKITRALFF